MNEKEMNEKIKFLQEELKATTRILEAREEKLDQLQYYVSDCNETIDDLRNENKELIKKLEAYNIPA